jgi:cytochrome c553
MRTALVVLFLVGAIGWVTPLAAGEVEAGRALYARVCLGCHGMQGEGSGDRKRALEGDLSVGELARLIQRTMPEDDPGSLTQEQARDVAAYIHEAFYSPVARERLRPPRVELSRLTARQYRYAVADLVGSFGPALPERGEPGLKGLYFQGRRLAGEKESVLKRSDPRIAFDFGTAAPVPEITEPQEFSIRWEGALWAPVTGEYEFVIRTEHAARLWLNGNATPLIDAWVKSGAETEYRGTIFLLAGRPYPLRVEYTKGKQGVDDSAKQKKQESQPSSMTLLWRRPDEQSVAVVPSRVLSQARPPESFVCATSFPPDDRSFGWERGNAVSKGWEQATTAAALETADYILSHLDTLAGTKEDAEDRRAKLEEFCVRFAERAFRRPISASQREILVSRPFATASDADQAVRQSVLRVLKFPQFLYHEFRPVGDDWDVAARLAWALWDSIPDDLLRGAAARGELATEEQRRAQAERMLADPRGRTKLREFVFVWLKADLPLEVVKDQNLFPGYDDSLLSDLRTSLELFWDAVVWSEASDFRQLLSGEELWLNDRLSRWYGEELPAGSEFEPVVRRGEQRAGVVTHPYLMTRLARTDESSPIHRGVFLARGVLGRLLKPPPEAVTPLPIEVQPDLSTRERVLLQTSPEACAACHALINPLGFALENFDAIGRFRREDRGRPVNAEGTYTSRTGEVVPFQGSRQLAEFLVTSPEVTAAFTQQLFQHLVQQAPAAWGPGTQDRLVEEFRASGWHVRRLAVRIAEFATQQPPLGP